MAKIRVKLESLARAGSTCRHVAIREHGTNKLLAYSHEDEIFTTPHRDELYLISEIKKVTSALITKTMTEAKLAVDGREFDDQPDNR